MNFRVSRQKTNTATSVKYLGVYLNDSLSWETHFKNVIHKLNRAIGLLSKVRHYTSKFLLKGIYYSLFNSKPDLVAKKNKFVQGGDKITK